MKKLSILLLASTGLLMSSCAREEETSCSVSQIEPGTEKFIQSDRSRCPDRAKSAEIHKTVSTKKI